jgi:hypothetical protein
MKLSACTPLTPNQLSELWHQFGMAATTAERWELSEHGEVIWPPPVTNKHQLTIAWLQEELHDQLGGLAVHRLALCTLIGIRAPDVAWLPTPNFDGMSPDGALLKSPPTLLKPAVTAAALCRRRRPAGRGHGAHARKTFFNRQGLSTPRKSRRRPTSRLRITPPCENCHSD